MDTSESLFPVVLMCLLHIHIKEHQISLDSGMLVSAVALSMWMEEGLSNVGRTPLGAV